MHKNKTPLPMRTPVVILHSSRVQHELVGLYTTWRDSLFTGSYICIYNVDIQFPYLCIVGLVVKYCKLKRCTTVL